VLDRYDRQVEGREDVVIQPLPGAEAVARLLAFTSAYAFLQPADAVRMLPLYARLVKQAPVRRLRYPNGFDMQDKVYDAVIADLVTSR
jgi:hypothetical protein